MLSPRNGILALLIAIIVGACALRFIDLETSPPGFYVDEAAIAAQVLCLRDSGHDLYGRRWPLFTPVLGGGFATAPFMYSGVAWTKIFGSSIASFRALSAAFGVLFVIATFFLSLKLWDSREAAWLSALCAAISPWAFQFSRISWDPALAPGLLALALVLFFAEDSRGKALVGGLIAAMAAYCYPPLRVQMALVFPIAFLLRRQLSRRASWKEPFFYFWTLVAVSSPLIALTLRGDLQRRFRVLSVFNERYLRQFGEPGILAGFREFVKNLMLNLSPNYLFVRGDLNPRHATGFLGEWSPLEIAAIVALVVFVFMHLRARKRSGRNVAVFTFAVYGYLAGVVPAALTWESNPHALRSIGALVFLALGAGGALAFFWRRGRVWQIAILVIALVPSAFYFTDYFYSYSRRVEFYFDAPIVAEFERLKEKEPLTEEAARNNLLLKNYPTLALRYFQQASGQAQCR